MKKTIILISTLLLLSCSADEQFINEETHSKIGDVLKTPDLYIPEFETDWQFRPNGYGIRKPILNDGTFRISYTTTNFGGTVLDTVITYSCPIANKAPQTINGQNDFVVNKVEDGIVDGYGDYNFQGLLSITSFQNGLPIGQVIKQTFDVDPTDLKSDYNFQYEILYDEPFMSIPARTADMYINRAIVKSGKVLVVVEVNPDGLINEPNRTNNVSTLPINVTINGTSNEFLGSAVLDMSVIDENKTVPPSDFIVTKNFQGRNKFVKLDWHCPYHEPFYVKHWFTVKKNGVVVADKIDHSEYVETVKGNYQNSVYTVTTTTVLGKSTPVTVTVAR
jgi:hypothetical protein